MDALPKLGCGLLKISQCLKIQGGLDVFEYRFAALCDLNGLVGADDFTRAGVADFLVEEVAGDKLVVAS